MTNNFLSIIPGSMVYFENDTWEIRLVYDASFVAGRNTRTNEVKRLRISELHSVSVLDKTADSFAELTATSPTIDKTEWEQAVRKYAIIRPLLEKGSQKSKQDIAEVATLAGVQPNTIYRWLRAFTATGQISSLLRHKRDDIGTSRLSPELDTLVTETIKELYLSDQKRKISSVYNAVKARCLKAKLPAPHINTIRNRIFSLSTELKLAKRYGSKFAKTQLEPLHGSFPGADSPLSYVQIDHTRMDIIVVDEIDRRPLGRPWLTMAIDVFSRMVCGFYISFNTPGTLGTAICLAHSILPKESWLAKRNITNEWPVWGCPQCIHLDNAKEFRGRVLKQACEEYGIRIEWRPVATPHWGGHIERLMGTIASALHDLPGTTFSNTHQKGKYDSSAKAALTLAELEQWLGEFITGVYHKRVHSELGTAPEKKWESGILGDDTTPGSGIPARPINEDRILLDFLPFEERTIQRYGVIIERIYYYGDVLRRYIKSKDPQDRSKARKFIFRYDPRDMSKVFFLDPSTNRYYEIPYSNMSHPPLSIWEIREARRHAAKLGIKDIDEAAIFSSHDRLRKLELTAQKSTRKAKRILQNNNTKKTDFYPKALKSQTPTMDAGSFESEKSAAATSTGNQDISIEAFDDIDVEVDD